MLISMDQNSIFPRQDYYIPYHFLHYCILRLFFLHLYTEQDIQSVVIINRCISFWWSMSFVQRIIERWQVLLEWFPGGQRKMTKCDSKYKKHVTLIKEIENLSFSRIKKPPWRLFDRKIVSYPNIVNNHCYCKDIFCKLAFWYNTYHMYSETSDKYFIL